MRELAAALLVVTLGAGCAPSDEPAPDVLVSGEGLLERPARLQLGTRAEATVPAELAGPLAELLAAEAFEIPADAWVAGAVLPAGSPEARLVDDERPLGRWRAEVPADLDLGLGAFWITHAGKPLRRVPSGGDLWAGGHHVFAWDAARRVLVHYGVDPPGAVAYGWRPLDEPSLVAWEPTLLGAPAPTRAADLVRRLQLGDRERPALLAPAPTTWTRPAVELQADALEVAVAVFDLGLELRQGRLARAAGRSDGVTFAVDVELPDGTRERAWSRHVPPGGAWTQARVDLSAWRGQVLNLHLLSEPGDDAGFDLACWSVLRLRGGARRAPERPHVVVVDIDTLRADRLGLDGYARDTSPQLDAWAAERAVVHTDAVSAADWTLPATASMLTGLAVRQHEVIDGPVRVTAAMQPLAARLAAVGYETWARTDGGFVTPTFGFSTGFDDFEWGSLADKDVRPDPFGGLLERLGARDAERPVFLFVQTYRVHAPYGYDPRFLDEREPYAGRFAGQAVSPAMLAQMSDDGGFGHVEAAEWAYVNALYDAGIARLDAQLGPFLRGLDGALDGAPVLVVVTSDHGEELGERGHGGHGHSLHDEVTRIPLVVAWPDGAPGRDERPAALVDLVPTVLDAVGLPADPALPGRSLRALRRGPRVRVAQHRATAEALWFDGWKWIEGEMGPRQQQLPVRLLYALRDDAAEADERAAAHPDIVERLAGRLRAWRKAHGPLGHVGTAAGALDPELLEQLAALGYVER